MKIDLVSAVGGLLALWCSVATGLAYLEEGAWPSLTDLKVLGILGGVALILASNLLYRSAEEGEEQGD